MAKESLEFLNNLRKSEYEVQIVENSTVHQSEIGEWLEVQRNLLTASTILEMPILELFCFWYLALGFE